MQPIVPGTSAATVRYNVPSLSQLELVSPLDTQSLHVFVARGLAASAPGMAPGGDIADRGTSYQVLTAANVPAGHPIEVDLKPAARSRDGSKPLAFVGIILLALVLAGAGWRR